MKNVILLLVLLIITAACHRKEPATQSYTYTISNTRDIAMQKGGSDTLLPHFNSATGIPEKIRLSVSGLPEEVTADLSQTEGYPSFILQVIFKATANAAPGVYPVKIMSSGSSAGLQTANINLSVIDDCSLSLVDTFNVTESCTADNYSYAVVVSATNTPYVVQMRNFGSYGYNTIIKVNLNCVNHTLFIPLQDVGGGFKVTGHGSFTDSSMNINYALSSDLNIEQDVCNDICLKLH